MLSFKSAGIQEYLKSANPNVEVTAKAYFERDKELGLTFSKVFEKAINKLCLNQKNIEQLINHQFKLYVSQQTKEFLKKKNKSELKFDYEHFFNTKIKSNEYQNLIKKYNTLLKYKETNDHLGFYKALTLDDLSNLGF